MLGSAAVGGVAIKHARVQRFLLHIAPVAGPLVFKAFRRRVAAGCRDARIAEWESPS